MANGKLKIKAVWRSKGWRDPDMIDLCREISRGKFRVSQLATDSHASPTTIRNWINGTTGRPQHCTLAAVARAAGKDFVLMDLPESKKKKAA